MQETRIRSLGWADPPEREWLPAPVFLPGEFHGQRTLAGYRPWGCKESDMIERETHTYTRTHARTHTHTHTHTRYRAVGGEECVVKDSLLNSQLGSCPSPSEAASDGFLDRKCLPVTACPCHETFRRIPGVAKSLLRTMASSPTAIHPGSSELHRCESCSADYLIDPQD